VTENKTARKYKYGEKGGTSEKDHKERLFRNDKSEGEKGGTSEKSERPSISERQKRKRQKNGGGKSQRREKEDTTGKTEHTAIKCHTWQASCSEIIPLFRGKLSANSFFYLIH